LRSSWKSFSSEPNQIENVNKKKGKETKETLFPYSEPGSIIKNKEEKKFKKFSG
jgi:hypothetical protein